MTSTISSWYHNQYSTWNRTRRMQASPYLARPETQTSRVTRAASRTDAQPGDAIINMGDLLPPSSTQAAARKKQDTLFGPSIGVVNPGPDWADQKLEQSEKAQLQDALTPELVKSWVEKSKQASQPTTTLQALVNLKRPSLRLSPISQDDAGDSVQPQQHGLEFHFDCDAPKCGISLHIITPQPIDSSTSSSGTQLVDVFHTAVEGGFGRVLKLEEGATLELDKYDTLAHTASASAPGPDGPPVTTSTPPAPTEPAAENGQNKKRFTLRIRKRTHPHAAEDANRVSVAGPALQVVDAETPAHNGNGTGSTVAGIVGNGAKNETQEKDEGGVKVLIKLEALDANDHTLVSPNSQATYLHIVRLGAAPAASTPDTRPWVVRVVKREATIGPHTFHLHEIYGLTSHSSPTTQSVTNLQAEPHVYPPAAGAVEDDPTSECLLCLSSPREVVLLPCRHLVACKECAVNMVEFGAGGQLVHGDEAGASAGDTNANVAGATTAETPGEGSGANEGEPAPAPAPVTPQAPRPINPRRKRKAKGWFCPVCRQPYTSLLRISTTAPSVKAKVVGEGDGEGDEDAVQVSTTPGVGAPGQQAAGAETQTQRPGFLRAISNAAARVTGSDNSNVRGNAVSA
ncbi:hypothetical protein JB92DRAFT_3126730 [Gautieria morchelliformis]|nr:hypothetical protein JB92DRAFT_3126730 [Gautieria morchelliformis]